MLFSYQSLDAAELDAVDDFLNMLVSLSLIEDREERCRFHLGLVVAKRWEAKVRFHAFHFKKKICIHTL